MDAGVPLKRPVAGIAMGLIKEGEKIRRPLGHPRRRGPSRRHGLQGRRHRDGVTSLQMDIKITGITEEIMKVALNQAQGRAHAHPRRDGQGDQRRRAPELGEYAPRIETIQIPTDKIREVIGSGGKVIREIVEKTGAKIDISDDGTVKIASANAEVDPRGAQVDQGHRGRTRGRRDLPGQGGQDHGLRRLREFLRPARRPGAHLPARRRAVARRTDVVKEGDKVWVKLIGFDERGKVRLSMKVVDQETGKEREKAEAAS